MDWDSLELTDGHDTPAIINDFYVGDNWFAFQVDQRDDNNSVVLDFTDVTRLDALIAALCQGRRESFGPVEEERSSKSSWHTTVTIDIVPNVQPLKDLLAALENMHKGY